MYVFGAIATGSVVLVAAFMELAHSPQGFFFDWLILAALTAISGSATVKLPSIPASLSVSETFVFTSVLLFGAPAGTLTVALDGLIISLWLRSNRKDIHRVLFNMAAPAISIWVASQVFFELAGIEPLAYSTAEVTVNDFLAPLLVFTVLFFGLNSWMIAFAVALETGESAMEIWRKNFMWLSLNFFCGASVAALLAVSVNPQHVDLTYLGAILPLLFVLYMTYRTSMGRVEDANQHLQRVNRLYLATIETLAHAIDAKDQVTHGHIRRVQTYTTRLAKALGISDDITLKAIEASALLHDMGKLAIPEHILNKPGKLSSAEFERMKLHASIGAEILSSIEFPYPVVPIVRHHHENWDGTGYPDGVSGVDIPIGARILSVVDCFDALTSDRPYRPALCTDEALAILKQRRGNMYDPLIVDTFERIHVDLVKEIAPENERTTANGVLVKAHSVEPQLEASARTPDRLSVLMLFQLLNDLSDQSWFDVADLVICRLRQAVTFTDCALFAYDTASDELEAVWSDGQEVGDRLRGRRMKLGEGLSGWVAANRRPILNSAASLDLLATDAGGSRFASTLSVPLLIKDRLVGVLSVYAEPAQAFDQRDLQILHSVSTHIAELVGKSVRATSKAIEQSGFPTAHHLDTYLRRRLSGDKGRPETTLVIVKAVLKSEDARQYMKELTQRVSEQLRGADLVFVCDATTVVCLLDTANEETARVIADRVLAEHAKRRRELAQLEIVTTVLVAPRDGRTLAQLLASAHVKLQKAVA